MDAGLRRHVLKEPALGDVETQVATEAPHGWTLSNVIAPDEAEDADCQQRHSHGDHQTCDEQLILLGPKR